MRKRKFSGILSFITAAHFVSNTEIGIPELNKGTESILHRKYFHTPPEVL
jgi:hypothetical protein